MGNSCSSPAVCAKPLKNCGTKYFCCCCPCKCWNKSKDDNKPVPVDPKVLGFIVAPADDVDCK